MCRSSRYDGSMDDYLALSLQQFKSAGARVLQQKRLGTSAAVFEYTGEMQGRLLHMYARAQKSVGKVYLVTGTAADEQWSTVASRLRTCVDSFRCDSGEERASPNATASPR